VRAENLPHDVPDTYRHVVIAGVERVIVESLGNMLGRQGYTVDAVIDGLNGSMNPVRTVRKFQPDCCIIDLQTAGEPEISQNLIDRILKAHEDVKVVALGTRGKGRTTQMQTINEAGRMVGFGAHGYIDSRLGNDALVSVIERVLCGEVAIKAVEAAAEQPKKSGITELDLAAHLTDRERQCLLMLVEGLDTAAMIEKLGVARTTVRTHLQALLTKLGAHSRLEAAAFAIRNRLPDLWAEDGLFIDGQPIKPDGLRGRGRE
jgi:two-component system nitrate/nitrite response regulator NarL